MPIYSIFLAGAMLLIFNEIMPLCGFNQKMINGLRQFNEGLYAQAEKRAREDGLSLRQSFDNEIKEMDIFKDILAKKGLRKFQALMGIALFAQALYRNAKGLNQPREVFLAEAESLLSFFIELDDKYYREFRPHTDPKTALKRLGAWLR